MKQPETIVVAEYLESIDEKYAAKEIRRLHEANQAMLEALKDLFGADMEYCMMGDGKDDQIEAIAKAKAAIAKGEQQ